jgi:hypothetical protein
MMSLSTGEQDALIAVPNLLRAVAALAMARERPDVAALVDEASLRRDGDAVIVVVGESKRGKSLLVNALLGEDVSPSDVARPSPAYVLLRHGTEKSVMVRRLASPDLQAVPAAEIAPLLESDGPEHPDGPVVYVEISLPSGLLARGITMIDAPGVDGLEAAHADATLAVLERADALTFVLDAGAPISLPELQFLQRATVRIGAVFFVLTKVDAHLDWEEIMAEDRELLARHVPQFASAPFFAVSSTEKREADALADEEGAAFSGVPAVADGLLSGVVEAGSTLRALNALHTVRSALGALDEPALAVSSATGAAVDDPPEVAIALLDFDTRTSDWHATLTVEFQRDVAIRIDTELRRRIAEVIRSYEARINARSGSTELERLLGDSLDVAQLRRDLVATLQALATETDTAVTTSARELLARILADLGLGPPGEDVSPPRAAPTLTFADPVPLREDAAQRLRNLSLVSSPLTAGRVVLPLLGGPALIGAGIGAAFGGLLVFGAEWYRRQARTRTEASVLVRDAVGQANVEIDAHLRVRLLETQQAVQAVVARTLEAHRASLQAHAEEELALRAASESQRREAIERAERHLGETEPLWRAALDIGRQLAGGPE